MVPHAYNPGVVQGLDGGRVRNAINKQAGAAWIPDKDRLTLVMLHAGLSCYFIVWPWSLCVPATIRSWQSLQMHAAMSWCPDTPSCLTQVAAWWC